MIASVTRTTPVAGLAVRVPLKSVEVETSMLVVFVGGASGAIVVSPLKATVLPGYWPSVGGGHCPIKIETLLLPLFATARSCFPSPLKSPTAIATGPLPAATGELAAGMTLHD